MHKVQLFCCFPQVYLGFFDVVKSSYFDGGCSGLGVRGTVRGRGGQGQFVADEPLSLGVSSGQKSLFEEERMRTWPKFFKGVEPL